MGSSIQHRKLAAGVAPLTQVRERQFNCRLPIPIIAVAKANAELLEQDVQKYVCDALAQHNDNVSRQLAKGK